MRDRERRRAADGPAAPGPAGSAGGPGEPAAANPADAAGAGPAAAAAAAGEPAAAGGGAGGHAASIRCGPGGACSRPGRTRRPVDVHQSVRLDLDALLPGIFLRHGRQRHGLRICLLSIGRLDVALCPLDPGLGTEPVLGAAGSGALRLVCTAIVAAWGSPTAGRCTTGARVLAAACASAVGATADPAGAGRSSDLPKMPHRRFLPRCRGETEDRP